MYQNVKHLRRTESFAANCDENEVYEGPDESSAAARSILIQNRLDCDNCAPAMINSCWRPLEYLKRLRVRICASLAKSGSEQNCFTVRRRIPGTDIAEEDELGPADGVVWPRNIVSAERIWMGAQT